MSKPSPNRIVAAFERKADPDYDWEVSGYPIEEDQGATAKFRGTEKEFLRFYRDRRFDDLWDDIQIENYELRSRKILDEWYVERNRLHKLASAGRVATAFVTAGYPGGPGQYGDATEDPGIYREEEPDPCKDAPYHYDLDIDDVHDCEGEAVTDWMEAVEGVVAGLKRLGFKVREGREYFEEGQLEQPLTIQGPHGKAEIGITGTISERGGLERIYTAIYRGADWWDFKHRNHGEIEMDNPNIRTFIKKVLEVWADGGLNRTRRAASAARVAAASLKQAALVQKRIKASLKIMRETGRSSTDSFGEAGDWREYLGLLAVVFDSNDFGPVPMKWQVSIKVRMRPDGRFEVDGSSPEIEVVKPKTRPLVGNFVSILAHELLVNDDFTGTISKKQAELKTARLADIPKAARVFEDSMADLKASAEKLKRLFKQHPMINDDWGQGEAAEELVTDTLKAIKKLQENPIDLGVYATFGMKNHRKEANQRSENV